MQQVCRAMVAYGILSPLRIHMSLYIVPYTHIAFADMSIVDNQSPQGATSILHLEYAHRPADIATITNLTAAFSVERCCIEYQQGLLWSTDTLNLNTIYDQTNNLATASDPLVACELGRPNTL